MTQCAFHIKIIFSLVSGGMVCLYTQLKNVLQVSHCISF